MTGAMTHDAGRIVRDGATWYGYFIAGLQIFLTVRPQVLQSIRVRRVHVETNDILRTHPRICKYGQRVLPDLIMLSFEPFRYAAVWPHTDLARGKDPPRIRRNLNTVAVLRGRSRDRGWVARFQHR